MQPRQVITLLFSNAKAVLNQHAVVFLGVLLAGCGALSQSDAPDWQAQQAIPETWYQVQTSPVVSAEPLLILPNKITQLIGAELQHNPQLTADHARYQIARYDLEAIQADRWPDLNISASAQKRQATDKQWLSGYGAGVRISWEADVWGKLSDLERAGFANLKSFQLDYEAAQQSLISRILLSYFELIQTKDLIALTDKNLQSQQKRVQITASRLDAGLQTSHDLRLALNSLHSIEATRVQQAISYHKAKQTFNLLLGRYPETEVESLLEDVQLPPVQLELSPRKVMQQRPDVIAAEFRLTRAYYQSQEADKARLPNLTLKTNAVSSVDDVAKLFDWQYWLITLSAELAQPIFDGGKISANQNEMKVRQDLAMAQYKDVLLQSFQEVEMGIYSESALREKHRSLELAYEQIFAAEQQVNKHYEAGLANSFELLTLQERRIRTETDLMRSHYEILANRIRLILALGERFPIDVEPNIEVVH